MKSLLKWMLAGFFVVSAVASAENPMVSFQKLHSDWHQKTIPVEKGEANPGIDQMAIAFCEAWQTGICSSVARYLKNPRRYSSTYSRNHEIGYSVDIYPSKTAMSATDENTDAPYFYATLWRRSNGHTLLGIHTGVPTDPQADVVLFYDYDPEKAQLVPEKSTCDFVTLKKDKDIWIELPHKGEDLRLMVFGGEKAVQYWFHFNGMAFDQPTSSAF